MEFPCLVPLSLKPRDLFLQTVLAPIGKLAVIFVLALIGTKLRIRIKVIIKKLIHKRIPLGVRRFVAGSVRGLVGTLIGRGPATAS